jgi:hypothetical protein
MYQGVEAYPRWDLASVLIHSPTLAEFEYRYDFVALVPGLEMDLVPPPPMTYNLLKLAYYHA